ncbi:MAG: radical SAM protein [Ignisphaera sp.]|uniref:Radical SAM protein n=1 Tax=Ignisphaera aggregans TaxID=334771 RepID=A0A7J3N0D4_9CREN
MEHNNDSYTHVFHIVYFDYDSSAYIHFYNCNFRCLGCIRRLSIWDCHLPSETISSLRFSGFLSYRGLETLAKELISVYGMKRVVLGGGEPSIDPAIAMITRMLKDLGLEIKMLTNSYSLSRDLVEELRDPRVTVIASVKSIDPKKHREYTGFPLEPVLTNITNMYESGINIAIETILIPGFNDVEEIRRLAKFIASLDRDILLIIDSFIPVPGALWRKPTLDELDRVEQEASKYLENVYVRGRTISSGLRGEIYLIYPRPLDRNSTQNLYTG